MKIALSLIGGAILWAAALFAMVTLPKHFIEASHWQYNWTMTYVNTHRDIIGQDVVDEVFRDGKLTVAEYERIDRIMDNHLLNEAKVRFLKYDSGN